MNSRRKLKNSSRRLVFAAFFAALTAVCAQIALPLPTGVPISFATFAVMLSGAVLGGVSGAVSQLVYLLIGAVGVPVFAGFRGGLDRLAGPTGGYLIGYVLMALVIGAVISRFGRSFAVSALAMTAGCAVCYLLGTVWYMAMTQTALIPALMGCVLPFLPGEAVKILLGAACVRRIRSSVFR